MSKPTRRPGSAVYYARRVIPKELQAAYGRREIWKSLGVTDCEKAKPLERLQQTAWDEEFKAAKAKLAATPEKPTAPRRPLTPAEQAERERQPQAQPAPNGGGDFASLMSSPPVSRMSLGARSLSEAIGSPSASRERR
ncbi:DUF6538 domain-containing protein [Phenylobacterium sp.]|uniref:DUF6538 domain-containing protein n=1 Tax=Phenylobacterium sp. TaxID=1871053 RepID=UPI003446DC5F